MLSRFFRGNLTPELTEEILKVVQPLLALSKPMKPEEDTRLLSEDDQLYLFEVVGVVIISGERQEQVNIFRQSYLIAFSRIVS